MGVVCSKNTKKKSKLIKEMDREMSIDIHIYNIRCSDMKIVV